MDPDSDTSLEPSARAGRALRPATPRHRPRYSKVPEVTAFFWFIKALTTGMGESTSDFLVHMVPEIAVFFGAIAFVVALYLQFSTDRYVPWTYWLAVAMVGVFGTMARTCCTSASAFRTSPRPSSTRSSSPSSSGPGTQ